MSHVPDWLQWLNYLLWPVVVLSILLVFGYFFSTIANWIAAPFSGLLAEQLEARLTGATPPDVGVFGIMKDIPRIMKREWQKLAWYLPRAIVLLLLYFIPGVGQTVAPVLWFLFSAWMLAIQYCDYPFDNHKVPSNHARSAAQPQSDEYAVWRAHQPVHHDPGVKPGDPAGGYLRRHRHVGRLLSR
jgi:CysZ protein